MLKGGGCADSSPPLPGDRPSQVAHSRPRGPREGGVEKELSLSAWGVCGEAGRGGGGELSPSCGPEADAVGSTGASQTARGPGTRGWAPRPRGIPSLLTPGGPHAPAIPELIRSAHQPIGASHSRHTRKAASPAHVPAASPRRGFAGPRAAPKTPSLCLMGSPWAETISQDRGTIDAH